MIAAHERSAWVGIAAGATMGGVAAALVTAHGPLIGSVESVAVASAPALVLSPVLVACSAIVSSALQAFGTPIAAATIRPCHLLAAPLLFVTMVRMLQRGSVGFGMHPFLAPLCGFLGVSVLSIVFAPSVTESARFALLLLIMFVLYLGVSDALDSPRRLRLGIAVLVGVAVGATLLALAQFTVTILEGQPVLALSPSQERFLVRFGRPSGTFYEPDWLGEFLLYALLLILPATAEQGRRWQRWAARVGCGVLFSGLLLSQVRSAFLGLLAGLVTWAWIEGARPLTVLRRVGGAAALLGCALAVLYVVAPDPANRALARFTGVLEMNRATEQGSATVTRINTMRGQVGILTGMPLGILTGRGLGSWEEFAMRIMAHGDPEESVMVGKSGPNLLLNAWFDSGIAGLAAMMWLLMRVVRSHTRCLHRRSDPTRAATTGSLMAIVGLVVFSLFNSALAEGFFWVQLGISEAIVRSNREGAA